MGTVSRRKVAGPQDHPGPGMDLRANHQEPVSSICILSLASICLVNWDGAYVRNPVHSITGHLSTFVSSYPSVPDDVPTPRRLSLRLVCHPRHGSSRRRPLRLRPVPAQVIRYPVGSCRINLVHRAFRSLQLALRVAPVLS